MTLQCGEKLFFEGKREDFKITDDDVKRFVESWVKLRYTWTEFDPQKVLDAVGPLSTQDLQNKLKPVLQKTKVDATKPNQKFEITVTNIRVTLAAKEAVASFDTIVRLNGFPIVVPGEVSLEIIQGMPTKWNYLGLYVNGVIEHEVK